MGKFINPFSDWGFKLIFGQEITKDLLISFLNDLLKGEHTITDITFKDKEQLPEAKNMRGIIYDIYCTTDQGQHIIVEMQNRYQEFIVFLKIACEKAPEALEYTVGRFIPEEVEAKDFYQYVLTHSDIFTHFNPDSSAPVKPM